MSKDRDTSPLYELVHRPGARDARGMKLPKWMRGQDAETPREAEESGPATASSEPWRIGPWLRYPLRFRLSRWLVAMVVLMWVGLIVVAVLVGRKLGYDAATAGEARYQQLVEPLMQIREQPPNRQLIPRDVPVMIQQPGRDAATDPDAVVPPPPPAAAGATGDASDPRQSGLNYFRLMTIPAVSRGEGDRAVAFLAGEGIDAALIPVNNGVSLKLIVLRGFTRPLSDPKAQALAERLKALGRKFKAQHRGSTDWHGLYAEKYRPGRN